MAPGDKVSSLLKEEHLEAVGTTEISDIAELKKDIKSIYDYKVLVSGMCCQSYLLIK